MSLDDALKVDPEDDFSSVIDGNLQILKEHSEESQTRFFNPPDIRKLLHRGTLTRTHLTFCRRTNNDSIS